MYKLKDDGAFFKTIACSIRNHGIDSKAINHYEEIVQELYNCPCEWLAELLNLIQDFAKQHSYEELRQKHNGHSWVEFMYAVCGEWTDRVIHGRTV